jgi:RNA polymerase sigma factor for flagellar operon FliA
MYTAQGVLAKEQLVFKYAPFVKRIAFHMMAKLPASVMVDDLVQNGMLGLLDALGRFEEGMGAQFETYAVQRIRGAMLDGLRENDWLPRGVRREMRRIETAIQFVSDQQASAKWYAGVLGIEPTPYEGPYFKFDEHAYLILAPARPGTGTRAATSVDAWDVRHPPCAVTRVRSPTRDEKS